MKVTFINFSSFRNFFLVVAVGIIAASWYLTNNLVSEMAKEERNRMQLWADATTQIATADPGTDFNFCLKVIEGNYSIPVIIVDGEGVPYQHRNLDIAGEKADPDTTELRKIVEEFAEKNPPIEIRLDENTIHKLYYGDSLLLTRLTTYPIIQWAIIVAFFLIFFGVIVAMKKAEQDRVWVGLSKETAHQLGTPISSLMAWVELLKENGTDEMITSEIDKDVSRLKVIADRFSKVGSRPEMEVGHLNEVIDSSLAYMRQRTSKRISLSSEYECGVPALCSMCVPLFQWVVENLCKNAVDAIESGEGAIRVCVSQSGNEYIIDVSDTGKGIPSSKRKKVFEPGYTTKKRGWGLGLSLAKRIIEEYHKGKIFVQSSEVGKGSVFRIIMPVNYSGDNHSYNMDK